MNGVDQGEAATNVPPDVYGVIDLYGQAAQATIIDSSGISLYTLIDFAIYGALSCVWHKYVGGYKN